MPGGHSLFGTRAAPVLGPKALSPGSAHFNGSSSLELSPGFSVPAGTSFSYSFWYQLKTATSNYNIMCQVASPSAPASNMWWIGEVDAFGVVRPVAYAADGSNASPGGTGDAVNVWVFYVVAYDGSVPCIKARKGGGSYSVCAGGLSLPMHNNAGACPLIVGNGGGDGFAHPPTGLIGNIDSLFFWDRVLTAAETDTLYNGGAGLDASGLTGSLASGLIAAYNLDGPVHGKWPDSSGNGNHLSVNGTVTVGPPRGH